MKRLLIGAAAGAAATVPMTMVMETLHRTLDGEPPRPLPPREVTEGVAAQAGVDHLLDERDKQQLTLAAHVGYGAACGALFGLVAPRNPAGAIAAGVAYGLGVWAGSYLGWLPALDVRHHARHDPPARNGLMIAAHVVYGATLGALTGVSRTPPRARAFCEDRGRA